MKIAALQPAWMLACSLVAFSLITACTTNSPIEGKPIPERGDRSSANQLAKNDMDRMADVELEENMQSLRNLMLKLYKRNPNQLAKSTADPAEKQCSTNIDAHR